MRKHRYAVPAAVAGLVALVLILAIAAFARPGSGEGASVAQGSPPAERFKERLVAAGVEDIGMPIEGFDPSLLVMAFPGLAEADFDGVSALGGGYVFRNGELTFVRKDAGAASSAERTIVGDGYAELLANVSRRLGMPASTAEQVDAIVARIDTGEHVEAGIGGQATALGVTVAPKEVLEDGRCPAETQCIRAGTVRVRVAVTIEGHERPQEFTLGAKVTLGGVDVTLQQVEPQRRDGTELAAYEYRFSFGIVRH